jgi:hypothetical protein
MANRAQELIKTYYEEEAARKESEITYTDYTVRLNSSDIAMLEIIAKRFGKSADRIASEAVSAAIYSMVEALETSERKTLAKEADELNESLSKKAAKANGKPDFEEKSVTWVMNDRAITREENKKKKEVEEKSEPVAMNSNPVEKDEVATAATSEPATNVFEASNESTESSNSVFAS